MNRVDTHYPDYNVMALSEEWDSHTKEIVKKRLGPFPEYKFLTEKEAEYLKIIARHIVYDYREDIIEWVVHYFDQKLQSPIGEGQRKEKVPAEQELIRKGLMALEHLSRLSYGKEFGQLEVAQQFQILASLQKGQAARIPEWSQVPQKELFNKLAGEIAAAFYSHPQIWSEIGYGGPVYPKSYVRIEFGLIDPWEAKLSGK